MIMAYVLRKIGNADNVAVNYYEVDTEHDMLEIDVTNAPWVVVVMLLKAGIRIF